MKLGVMLSLFAQLAFDDVLDYCAQIGVQAIELPIGAYPTDPWHLAGICSEKKRLKELKQKIKDHGLEVHGIAVHGNPVHPDENIAKMHRKVHRDGVLLAAEFNTTVINFSGCPGGCAGDKTPNFVTCPWPDDYTKISEYQWEHVLIPFWTEECKFAKKHGVHIALEAHPGMTVHNPEDVVRLRTAAGQQIGANLDPSHLFWQGIDPIQAIRYLSEHNCIFHVHAKDTYIDVHNSLIKGNLDISNYSQITNRSWYFRTVGYGHGNDFWNAFISTLKLHGYDGVISIEHEDALMSVKEGFEKAVEYLNNTIIQGKPAQAWWC